MPAAKEREQGVSLQQNVLIWMVANQPDLNPMTTQNGGSRVTAVD